MADPPTDEHGQKEATIEGQAQGNREDTITEPEQDEAAEVAATVEDDHADPTAEMPHEESSALAPSNDDLASELTAVRAERDAFLASTEETAGELTKAQDALAELQKQFTYVSAAKEAVEKQLQAERDKREAAEESVELLRSRLDDARKAVTGLQGQDQRRRTTLGYGAPPGDAGQSELLAEPQTDVRSKRSSILGVQALKAHRRISSQSEPGYESLGFGTSAASPSTATAPAIPPAARTKPGGLRELRLGSSPATPDNKPPVSPEIPSEERLGAPTPEGGMAGISKRWSTIGIFRNATLPASSEVAEEGQAGPSSSPPQRPVLGARNSSESLQDRLQAFITKEPSEGSSQQTKSMEAQIASLQAQLAESQEARLASENAVKILREFLSSNTPDATPGAGGSETGLQSPVQGLRLPPLPTDTSADQEEERYAARQANTRKVSGWTLRLWKDTPGAGKGPEPPSSASSSAQGLQESPHILGGGGSSTQATPSTPGVDAASTTDTAGSRLMSFFGKAKSPAQQETAVLPSVVMPERNAGDAEQDDAISAKAVDLVKDGADDDAEPAKPSAEDKVA